MPNAKDDLTRLRQQKYDQRQLVRSLQRATYLDGQLDALDRLADAQAQLYEIENRIDNAQADVYSPVDEVSVGVPIEHSRSVAQRDGSQAGEYYSSSAHRGIDTTGLEVEVHLKMEYLPSAIYHLLNQDDRPLVECKIQTNSSSRRRLRVIAYIEGYSAQAVRTVEISREEPETISLLPTLFHDKIKQVTELTRASLNVLAEDLDNNKIEVHITTPIWLLSRNSATFLIRDPATGKRQDLTHYLGAFVTPNQETVMDFLRTVVDHHPDRRLDGYYGDGNPTLQAKAIFTALKEKARISYVNSLVCFGPEEETVGQRVRLPRETLEQRQANCVDGTLLFASLLEATSLNPAIIIVPQHVFVGWELSPNSDQWKYLDTVMIGGSKGFDEALRIGTRYAEAFSELQKHSSPYETWFRLLPIRKLRTEYRITPLE